jgi:hypothetical protein
MDETRNCGEINRELLLRPEAEVVLGRAVRRCRPTAGFVRFLQPEAADPNRRTYRRASPRETKSGAPIVVANLVPTHDRGPGPPGGRSTWLLLSPNCERTGRRRRGLLSAGRQRSIRLCFCPASQPVARLRYRVDPAATDTPPRPNAALVLSPRRSCQARSRGDHCFAAEAATRGGDVQLLQ